MPGASSRRRGRSERADRLGQRAAAGQPPGAQQGGNRRAGDEPRPVDRRVHAERHDDAQHASRSPARSAARASSRPSSPGAPGGASVRRAAAPHASSSASDTAIPISPKSANVWITKLWAVGTVFAIRRVARDRGLRSRTRPPRAAAVLADLAGPRSSSGRGRCRAGRASQACSGRRCWCWSRSRRGARSRRSAHARRRPARRTPATGMSAAAAASPRPIRRRPAASSVIRSVRNAAEHADERSGPPASGPARSRSRARRPSASAARSGRGSSAWVWMA